MPCASSGTPPRSRSAPQVQSAAPAVNITTVYRTLDLMERIGLVRHTHLGHGAPTYSEQEHQHVHLVCHSCGGSPRSPPS